MVTLVELNQDNWEDCADLQVSEEQSQFIASNLYSIAEVQFYHGLSLKGSSIKKHSLG